MFDPFNLHKTNRKTQRNGQIIRCKPIKQPFTYDLSTWKTYYDWAKKNGLVNDNPPTPESYDSAFINWSNADTILWNLEAYPEYEYAKKISLTRTFRIGNSINAYAYPNCLIVYLNDEAFNRTVYVTDPTKYCFLYYSTSEANQNIVVNYNIDLVDNYIDVTIYDTYNSHFLWCNNDGIGNSNNYAFSPTSPATNTYGKKLSWRVEDINPYTYICQAACYQVDEPTSSQIVNGRLVDILYLRSTTPSYGVTQINQVFY